MLVPPQRLRALLADRVVVNSSLIIVTTVLMAGAGALFWIVAARLAPRAEVGVASTLVTTTEALAIFAQLGLNVALVRVLPRSERPSSDILGAALLVGSVASILALGYGLLLPVTAPRVAEVVAWPLTLFVFMILAGATAVNQLTDEMFLGVDRVHANLWINGVLLGVVKVAAPFLLVTFGAMGVYGSVSGAAAIAGLVSVVVLIRGLPDRASLRPSVQLRAAVALSSAGYLSSVLMVVPQLVFPIIVINAQGAEEAAVYFIAFQVAMLLNVGAYAIANSTFAEASRHPERARNIALSGARTLAVAVSFGVIVLVLVAPLLLHVFGPEYNAHGVPTLRLLALGALGVSTNVWVAFAMRIMNSLQSMVAVQAVTTTTVIVAGVSVAHLGIEAVAVAWGLGQLFGGLVGVVTVVRMGLLSAPTTPAAPTTPTTPTVEES